MSGLEQNLDAYAVLSDILYTLREHVNQALTARYPDGWHREPSLATLVDRLIARKEREKAIDWYSSEYQALIEFASFEDILEILEGHTDLVPQLEVLVPSPHLLHARMLELEALREKLAMARAVTENELSFLTTFHQRFRKALDEAPAEAEPAPVPGTGARPETEAPEPEEPGDEAPEASIEVEAPPEEEESGDGEAATPPAETASEPPKGRAAKRGKGAAASAAAAPAEAEPAPAPAANTITTAIENGDTREILRFLYREVTAIADGLFSSDSAPAPVYWKAVRGSEWYEANFSTLGLKPLSDFYAVVEKAIERRREGAGREDVQEFLKQHNFAKILLGLRDMFQKNRL